jgi:surfeit locus 1 family protein
MRSHSYVLAAVLTALALAVLIGLGTWQIQRLHWKDDMVARVEARVSEPPSKLPPAEEWPQIDLATWEYRPVEAAGRFRHDLESRVYTLLSDAKGALEGPGYWIMTPLELADGTGTILVNRGFVPLEIGQPLDRPEGEVVVRGLLRGPEDRNMFTPDDRPGERLFYARDAGAIGAGLGLAKVAPFTIDAVVTPAGTLPQGGETRLVFPNRHLEYALTWYGLAGALAGVFIVFTLSRRRRG